MNLEIKKKLLALLQIVLITILLFLFVDFTIGKNIYKKLIRKNFVDVNTDIGLKDEIYDHKFKPSLNTLAAWGPIRFNFCTDKNGFRSNCKNQFLDDKSYDIAFIGDSFTEPVGIEYEHSFIGIIDNNLENKKVVNLAAPSYSTSIYYAKINNLIKREFKFKEVVVFLDISDLIDDALCYQLKNDKVIRRSSFDSCNQKIVKKNAFYIFFHENFYLSKELLKILNINIRYSVPKHILNNFRSSWTYNYNQQVLKYSYSEISNVMLKNMNELYDLLQKNNISLSIAVYPWPGTLYNDVKDNLHLKLWKSFCENKCKNFYDFMTPFFNMKETVSFEEIYKKYYFENDVHFNSNGNKIIAELFLKQYK